jgi:hypothetical protein
MYSAALGLTQLTAVGQHFADRLEQKDIENENEDAEVDQLDNK